MVDEAVPATDAEVASTKTSDDPSNLHVAKAMLTRHISDWGIPVHPNQETLIENAAKAMLDAVDSHVAGGGGTDAPPEVEVPPEASAVTYADEEAEDEEEDAAASTKGSKKRKY